MKVPCSVGMRIEKIEKKYEESAMSIEMRKARAKILKRILNSLTVEIHELKTRGESDIEDLENARSAITRFCNKLLSCSRGSNISRHAHNGSREYHYDAPVMKRAA